MDGEPRASLEYLVGEADIAVRAGWALIANGMDAAAAGEAFFSAGIDLKRYALLAPVMTPAKGMPPADLRAALLQLENAGMVPPTE